MPETQPYETGGMTFTDLCLLDEDGKELPFSQLTDQQIHEYVAAFYELLLHMRYKANLH